MLVTFTCKQRAAKAKTRIGLEQRLGTEVARSMANQAERQLIKFVLRPECKIASLSIQANLAAAGCRRLLQAAAGCWAPAAGTHPATWLTQCAIQKLFYWKIHWDSNVAIT